MDLTWYKSEYKYITDMCKIMIKMLKLKEKMAIFLASVLSQNLVL